MRAVLNSSSRYLINRCGFPGAFAVFLARDKPLILENVAVVGDRCLFCIFQARTDKIVVPIGRSW